jgi:putative MATE family efflux protein
VTQTLLQRSTDIRPQRALAWQVLLLALPVVVEHTLHIGVGLTDTYLANHLAEPFAAPATAAVGTISYMLWFVVLLVAAIGTGSTAIIARAKGARHRSLANSVAGQSMTSAAILGLILAALAWAAGEPIVAMTRLSGQAGDFALSYLRMLSVALPFMTVMFVANASLRGAGDTLTPAIAMVVVDIVNVAFSFALVHGWWGLPRMGFEGIAAGTVIAYIVGGVLQFVVLISGRGGIRLHLHRLRPHWLTLKRLLRIGGPAGFEGLLAWLANFAVVIIINQMDRTNVAPAAHINTVRIESLSFMIGLAFGTAAATMVGQSLGMRDPRRASRSAHLAYCWAGTFMTLCGVVFVLFNQQLSHFTSSDDAVADLTARCLRVTGYVQTGFAALTVYTAALRGAGDTLKVMMINLASIIGLRLVGVVIVGLWLKMGLVAIWVVLSVELFLRGLMIFLRFLHGGWKHVRV